MSILNNCHLEIFEKMAFLAIFLKRAIKKKGNIYDIQMAIFPMVRLSPNEKIYSEN